MEQRGIELERGHGDQHFAISIGGGDGFQTAQRRQIGAKPHPRRQKGQAECGGLQPPLEHAFVEFEHGDLPGFAGFAEPGFERDGVERDKGKDQLLDLARRAQHADIRAAVGHHGEVFQIGAEDFAHQRHRFAARTPAAYADGHTIAQLADYISRRHDFIHVRYLLIR